jgi:aspartate/methionine/tyrosine aminotransferase
MFGPTAYLRWARRFYGHVEFDLATSGISPLPMDELGRLPRLEDAGAWGGLRERIAVHNHVTPGEALPVLGATHALWAAYASLLSPGDEVLVERPTYEPMHRIPEGFGARVTWFERPHGERFALDPTRIERALTARTRVVALTNLHNPGGVRASAETLRRIAELAQKHGAYLLVDEVYSPFDEMCDGRGTWPKSARHLAPNIVAASSLTKAYGLGAHRIGWLLAPPDVIDRAEDALMSNLGHAPLAWCALGIAAFDRLPELGARARSLLGEKRARVERWVASRPHLAWSAPGEGLFGFAVDSRGGDLTESIERGAREFGVLVAAGSFFGVPEGFRLSWSIDAAKLDEGLAHLERALP